MPEKYITIPELAKILGVSRIAIYNRVKKGADSCYQKLAGLMLSQIRRLKRFWVEP